MRHTHLIMAGLISTLASQPGAGQEDDIVLGRPSSIRSGTGNQETLVLESGSRIRQRPRRDAAVLEVLNARLELPILDRLPGWVKVRYGSWQGWVELPDPEATTGQPPPVTVQPDDERLQRARDLLATDDEVSKLGPFTLYTDVENKELLEWLSLSATSVVETYRKRFQLDPGDRIAEAVVLFSAEKTYRRLENQEPGIAKAHSNGFTRDGVSVLFTGPTGRDEIASILIHELAHLLNRRVFGTAIPPWLDEGLAEDLAYCKVDERGGLKLGTLTGRILTNGDGTMTLTGPRAHLATLLTAWRSPSPPQLVQLLALDWEDFLRPDSRSVHYAESAFLVRLLLDGNLEELQPRFISYLTEVAASDLVESVSLWDTLQMEPDSLQPVLVQFATRQARAYGIPVNVGMTP